MQRNKNKMKMEKGISTRHNPAVIAKASTAGITLVALVVTIIVLIILATISINVIFSEDGILERAIQGQEDYNKGQAREKLVLALGDLAVDKQINVEYDENDFIDNALENQGMIVNGNIVIVDGWQFEIDRSVPKIVEELGKGEENKDIQISVTSTTSSDYTKATIKVEINYEGELSSVKIGQEEITKLTKEDGKYVIEVDVTDNKTYTILAKDVEDNYRLEKTEVSDITEDMDIWNKADLIEFSKRVNEGRTFEGKTVTVMDNIDFQGNEEEQYVPAGSDTTPFKGTFEGDNKTISNLYINNTNDYQGLIGYALEANISNVKIENASITGNNYVGAVVGQINNGQITNCISLKETDATANIKGNTYVGGITGHIVNTEISNCGNNLNITVTNRGGRNCRTK